ncbi:MAG: hypothetical protein HRU20_17530 [Pseudomonadales bacterium]|nr:hypothetical protein [Pseudomonadales bacterium]
MKKTTFKTVAVLGCSIGIAACGEKIKTAAPDPAPETGNLTFTNKVDTFQGGNPVSALSTFVYDADGKPLSQVDDSHGDGSVLHTYTYHYDAKGLLQSVDSDEDGDGPEPAQSFIVLSYDQNDNLTLLDYNVYKANSSNLYSVLGGQSYKGASLSDHFGGMDLNGIFKAAYTYYDDGAVKTRSLFSAGEATASEVITYTYHANGAIQTKAFDLDNDGTTESLKEYREDSVILSSISYNNAVPATATRVYSYSYYPNSKLLKTYKADFEPEAGAGSSNYTLDEYSYSADGRVALHEHFTNNDPVNVYRSITTVFENDVAKTGNIVSVAMKEHISNGAFWHDDYSYINETIIRERNNGSYSTVWSHSYNAQGQLTEYAFDGVKDGVYDFNYIYGFDADGRPASISKSLDEKASFINIKTLSYKGNLSVIDKINLPLEYENIFESFTGEPE